ncbi:hypothetical protein Dgeo_2947 (plasmid) [Deinococcus geothermalis DSM 11300]|uniref:Uncharacterized protein n=1 Tax=Deinococcus geothermalis (strain DSM 11300 / CIP 105573 / AG-3a) TaxID=319795 RepID=A8ZR81_DEIGD|nr:MULTISPECIES: hypothetical protein [Deinococcus]ABW34990.1 hypothetical protein Dgeo_2947 [Deinococcus geothermalis DSM 11300]TDE84980.1 hypothetical protein E0686_14150 [Deinococcus sp. S9]
MTTATFNLAAAIAIAYKLDPTLTSLPKAKLEGLSLKVIRHKFGEWFNTTVSTLMAVENEQEKKSLLGSAVDYRTRAVRWNLKKEMDLEFDEDFITRFRYAIMNCIRDEAYARINPSDRFTTPHVVKGREDEQQVLVLQAMDEIDKVTRSYSPVYRDSKLKEARESQYANDSKALVDAETEAEVDRLLKLARLSIGNGETPAEQLQSLLRTHDALTTHKLWKDVLKTPAEHLDRLKLALSLEAQFASAQSERVTAHQYVIAGDEVVVPRIAAHSVPSVDSVGTLHKRTYCYVITEGWSLVESGYVTAGSFDDARALTLALYSNLPEDDAAEEGTQGIEVFLA